MGILNFFKNYGKEKGASAGQNLMELIARLDPNGATEAEIDSMLEQLDGVTQQVVEARHSYKDKKQAADDLDGAYQRNLKAAQIIKGKLDQATTDGKQDEIAGLDASLSKQLDALEAMKPNRDLAVQIAEQDGAYLQQLEAAAEDKAKQLREARNTATQAKQEMQSAALMRKQAEEQANRAEVLAGIKEGSNQLGSAIAAMKGKAAKDRKAGEAALLKTDLLKDKPVAEDANIAAALKEASGEKAAPQTAADRLAALQ
jgi:hypothetical protein